MSAQLLIPDTDDCAAVLARGAAPLARLGGLADRCARWLMRCVDWAEGWVVKPNKRIIAERHCGAFEAANLFHLNMAEPETSLNSMVLFALS